MSIMKRAVSIDGVHYIVAEYIIALLYSAGERNPRDDILARLTAVLDELGTDRIRHLNKTSRNYN